MNKLCKTIVSALLFFAVIAAFFYLLIVGISSDYVPHMKRQEIEQADLSRELVSLSSSLCDWYPEQLLTPKDFAKGPIEPGSGSAMYGTYRMVLHIPAGRTYGISGLTCSYSQRVFINGVLLSEVGNPSDNAADFVPRTDSYSVFFTPETDETEIVFQIAHWNNKNGYFNLLYLGEQELIVAMNRSNFIANGLIVGTLAAFAAFFIGMFLFYPAKKHLLLFALMCFCSGLYFFIFQNKDIMALVPNLPWEVSHKLEYISLMATQVLLICYTASVVKIRSSHWHKAVFLGLTGAVMLYFAIAPSTFYSYHDVLPIGVYTLAVVIANLYVFYRAAKDKLLSYQENVIVLLSLLVGTGSYAFDLITSRNYNILPFATMLTVFFNSIAIIMQFSRTERELNMAQLREKEIAESNEMIARMSRLKGDFLHAVAHEMKTPLTIMSGFAQISEWQLQDGTADETTQNNLKNIYEEAARLSSMVERLSELSLGNELTPPKEKVDAAELLAYSSELCTPITRKRNNQLEAFCEPDVYLYANRDAILQVLFNLIVNANKHTDSGLIKIEIKCKDDFAVYTVEDTGSGISPELLPNIFEKGVSGDNGSGLGLSIAKECITDGGGIIELTRTGPEGTCFQFTVPLWKEDENEHCAFS